MNSMLRCRRYSLSLPLLALVFLGRICLPAYAGGPAVWSTDPRAAAGLATDVPFGAYTIRTPPGFGALASEDVYKDARRYQWRGDLRDDRTRPVITVWIAQLTREQASADPIAMGIKLLEDNGRAGAKSYERAKSENGMLPSGIWATRFSDQAVVATKDIDVRLRAVNYVWLDRGRLVMACAYDAQNHVKDTMPAMEAALFSIRDLDEKSASPSP